MDRESFEQLMEAGEFGNPVHSVPEWGKPIPFSNPNTPDFPVESLPVAVGAFVEQLAESTQTPEEMAGILSLGILATAFQSRYPVRQYLHGVGDGYPQAVLSEFIQDLPSRSELRQGYHGGNAAAEPAEGGVGRVIQREQRKGDGVSLSPVKVWKMPQKSAHKKEACAVRKIRETPNRKTTYPNIPDTLKITENNVCLPVKTRC